MRRDFGILTAVALAVGLSCSLRPATAPDLAAEVVAIEMPAAGAKTPLVTSIERHLKRFQMRLSEREIRDVARTIVEESERWSLDPELVLAVIRIESGYNNFAASRVGALGLMQVMPQTGVRVAADLGLPWRGPRTLHEPIANVKIGTAYLAWLFERYGRWDRALAAYNWGPGRIDRKLAAGHRVPETYVAQVYAALSTQSLLRP